MGLITLVVAAAAIYYFRPEKTQAPNSNSPVTVTSFAECQGAGYPVSESSPEVCRTPDGKTFVKASEEKSPEVVVEIPKSGDLIKSPLTVKGKAKGSWFFEANIPVTLKDQSGKVLAQKGFQAKGDWMATGYVEFEGLLTFTAPTTQYGTLQIEKDNPSGLEINDGSFVVPVRFK